MHKIVAAGLSVGLLFGAASAKAQVTDRCVGGVTPTATGAYIILFDPKSAEIKPRAKREIAEVANAARQRYASHICLDAYADSVPGVDPDLALAQKRADVVMSELAANGYPAEKISVRNIIDAKGLNRITGSESRTERKVEIRFGR